MGRQIELSFKLLTQIRRRCEKDRKRERKGIQERSGRRKRRDKEKEEEEERMLRRERGWTTKRTWRTTTSRHEVYSYVDTYRHRYRYINRLEREWRRRTRRKNEKRSFTSDPQTLVRKERQHEQDTWRSSVPGRCVHTPVSSLSKPGERERETAFFVRSSMNQSNSTAYT